MASETRIKVRVTPEQLAALRRNEKEAGVAIDEQVGQALDEWLREKTPKPKRPRAKARRS
jgi:hypothetical protein